MKLIKDPQEEQEAGFLKTICSGNYNLKSPRMQLRGEIIKHHRGKLDIMVMLYYQSNTIRCITG